MYYYFAQVETGYGCQNYGETDAYNSCEVLSSSTNEPLSNTGTYLTTSMIVGFLLLGIALFMLIKGKKK